MRLHHAVSALLLLAAVSACAVQSTDEVTKPGQSTSGIFHSKTDDIVVKTEPAFKGLKQIAIGSFQVGFIEYKKASAKAGGGLLGNGMGGRSTAKMTMSGIDAATMQKITDAAYDDFVKRMKAQGVTVIENAQMMSDPLFKDISNSSPSPKRDEASMFGSTNTITYVAPTKIGKLYDTMGLGAIGWNMAVTKYAPQHNAPVVYVNYMVDFANADGSGGWWSSSSSMSVGQGLSVAPGGGINLIGGEGGSFSTNSGSVTLGQPVYSDQAFGKIANTNSDAYKGAEVAVNVATSLLGAGSNMSRDFEIAADPAKYKTISSKLLSDANGKLIDKIAALK